MSSTVLIYIAVIVSPVVCQTCQIGDYFNVGKQICVRCKKCPPGEFEVRPCLGTDNRKCGQCSSGTFSEDGRCKNCTKCAAGIIRPCKKTNDTYCAKEKDKEDGRDSTVVTVTVTLAAAGLLCAIFLAYFYYYKSRQRSCSKESTAEEQPMNQLQNQGDVVAGTDVGEKLNQKRLPEEQKKMTNV